MKNGVKGFAAGLLVGVVGLTTVFAAGGIKSSAFNTNKVSFNGKELDLSGNQMISVVKDGEDNSSNYMPVRAVLEQMGYKVDWDGNTNTVIIGNMPIELSAEGAKVKRELYDSLGLNPNDDENKEHFKEVNERLSKMGLDEITLMFLGVEDYYVYNDGGNALLGEYWEQYFSH